MFFKLLDYICRARWPEGQCVQRIKKCELCHRWFCDPAIMRSCNPTILNKISISAIIFSSEQNRTQNWENTYKNTKEIPKLVLFRRSHVRWSCNPAIRSDALHHKSSASSQSSAIIQQTWTTKWRKHTYKQAKEIPKLVLFRRSHVRRSCNPAIRSDALHHKLSASSQHLQSSNKPELQSEEKTLTNRLKKSQNSFFFEDRT